MAGRSSKEKDWRLLAIATRLKAKLLRATAAQKGPELTDLLSVVESKAEDRTEGVRRQLGCAFYNLAPCLVGEVANLNLN